MPSRGLLLILALVGCSSSGGDAPSASASAPPKKSCSEELPDAERKERCVEGESLCCVAFARSLDPKAPDYFSQLALVCAGGDEGSCQKVRDSALEPTQKVVAFERACTKIGRWPCRSAVLLALAYAKDRAPALIQNACRQEGEKTFRAGGTQVPCEARPTAEALLPLTKLGDSCGAGELAACQELADVDGGAAQLLARHALIARGVDPDAVIPQRVSKRIDTSAFAEAGRVTVRAAPGQKDKQLDEKWSALAKHPELLRCIGRAKETEGLKKPETLHMRGLIDKGGRVAYAENLARDGETALGTCARPRLEDQLVAGEELAVDSMGPRTFEIELVLIP